VRDIETTADISKTVLIRYGELNQSIENLKIANNNHMKMKN